MMIFFPLDIRPPQDVPVFPLVWSLSNVCECVWVEMKDLAHQPSQSGASATTKLFPSFFLFLSNHSRLFGFAVQCCCIVHHESLSATQT